MKHILFLFVFVPFFASSQSLSSLSDKTKGLKKKPGFITFYIDEPNNKIYLELTKLDTEILYQTSLPAGLGSNDIGLDRGLTGDTRIVRFSRAGNKIFLVQPNYSYRAITNNIAEKRAVEESFAQSILWGFPVEATTDTSVLIDADTILITRCHAGSQPHSKYEPGQLYF